MANTLPVLVSEVNPGDHLSNGEKVIDSYQSKGEHVLTLERVMPDGQIQTHQVSYPLSSLMRVKVLF